MTARDPIHLEKPLVGTDWHLLRFEEAESFNAAYERAQRQWIARNEGGAHQEFKPPFIKHEEVEQEWLTPGRMLVGMLSALAVCVAVAVAVLNYFR